MTLILIVERKEAIKLIRHFRRYSQDTGLIKIFPVDGKGIEINTELNIDGTYRTTVVRNKDLKIVYHQEDRGLEWRIRCNEWSKDFKSYFVEVKINPKILGGIHDYITAATYHNIDSAVTNFNLEVAKISPLLKNFDCYSLKRVDYCINFDLAELAPACTPEQIMDLIRRSDIPPYYKEWTEYDETAHRMKSQPGSFYLMNSSANINCYSKFMSLQDRSQKREVKGLSPIPVATMDAAHNIIRFEVQFKYRKMYTMSIKAKEAGNCNFNKYESLLTPVTCDNAINHYFKKVIGKGDWYTLQNAIRQIEGQHFNTQKATRLIHALQLVNRCRSLAKAKASLQGCDLEAFKRTLKELSGLNINPVTIPKEWGIKHIPNLLFTYYDNFQQEKDEKELTEFQSECLEEYIQEFGCLPT